MQNSVPKSVPEVGKIYAPKDYPGAHMKVVKVEFHDIGERFMFSVHCCDPDDPTERVDAQLPEGIWQVHEFAPVETEAILKMP